MLRIAPALLPKTRVLPIGDDLSTGPISGTVPSLPDRGGFTAHRFPKLLIRIFLRRRSGRHDILSAERFLRQMEDTGKSVYSFSAALLDGRPVCLDRFKGSVLLIVNTASECGFTPQYAGLEQLYLTYQDRGLVVLGFPCNQFGRQEPGTAEEIGTFCKCSYGVSFPMFEKIEVNGSATHPLYRFLKEGKRGILGTKRIKWNFTKFLVDRSGNVVGRFAPATKPEKLVDRIEGLLEKE